MGCGPDEAGGPSLPRRRPGGPPGRRVAAPLRPHGADVGRLRGSAGARAGPSARPSAVACRPDGEAVAPCRRGGRTITPRSARRSSSTSPWAPTRGAPPESAVCMRTGDDARAYRARGLAARARCRALGAPAAVSVAVRRHAGRLVRLASGRDAAAFPAVRPGESSRRTATSGSPPGRPRTSWTRRTFAASSTACRRGSRQVRSGTRWKPCRSRPTIRLCTACSWAIRRPGGTGTL